MADARVTHTHAIDTTTHTPGPWVVRDSLLSEGNLWFVTAGPRRVAETWRVRDAELIATAPDLLAVLRECAALLHDYQDIDAHGRPDRAMRLLPIVERVIEKAEGVQ